MKLNQEKCHLLVSGHRQENIWARIGQTKIWPVDAERKLKIHKTFRRRPGCLLNVLNTFNLRPVSTGWESRKQKLLGAEIVV